MWYKKIAQNIRNIISDKNMTISEFSEFVDIPNQTVRSILYGKCKDYKLSTIIKISSKLNISIDALVFGVNTSEI